MRDTVARILVAEFDVVGLVGDGCALIEAAERMRPDVLVIDISMPPAGGIEAASQLIRGGSRAKIVFLTVHTDSDYIRAALAAGALGYVVKQRLTTDLCHAIREAIAGRPFISPAPRAGGN
jgi:DNA-binding NarL/FixJ family response regulator